MQNAIANLNIIKGGCPHGMPSGACPVCSGMGGGGSSTKRKNEMSWDQCYSMGLVLKSAEKQNQLNNNIFNNNFQGNTIALNNLNPIAQKVIELGNFIQARLIQPAANVLNSIKATLTKSLVPVIRIFNEIANKISENLKEQMTKFTNISDKLVAIFGEIEKNIKDKLSDTFKKIKKKFFVFFEAIDSSMEQGDQEDNKDNFLLGDAYND